MSADPNLVRWVFASVAYALKAVATENELAVLVEHLDERTAAFMQAPDRIEIRITGPFIQELSQGCFRVWVDANVLLESRFDGSRKNANDILKYAGLFLEAMSTPIAVWNYGNEEGDYVDDDTPTQVFIGCLLPRPGRNESIRVFNFGQTTQTDKMKQSMVDARYEMYLP